jgi:hypothetical protein
LHAAHGGAALFEGVQGLFAEGIDVIEKRDQDDASGVSHRGERSSVNDIRSPEIAAL